MQKPAIDPSYYSLRVATDDDVDAVSALYARFYPVSWADSYPDDILNAVLPYVCTAHGDLVRSGHFFVIERHNSVKNIELREKEIVAAGGWSPHLFGREAEAVEGEGQVRHFAVDPALQGVGLGRRLIEAVLQSAEEAGIGVLHAVSSLVAEPFYRAAGFETIERSVQLIAGVDMSVIVMKRVKGV